MLGFGGLQQGFGAVDAGIGQVEFLPEKTPAAVAVDNRQFGALQPGIGGLGKDVGQQRAGIGAIAEVADAHLQRFRGLGLRGGRRACRKRRGQGQQAGQGKVGRLAHKATPRQMAPA
ncbi:hypothetical protein D3C72_1986410 [compost metagenome]